MAEIFATRMGHLHRAVKVCCNDNSDWANLGLENLFLNESFKQAVSAKYQQNAAQDPADASIRSDFDLIADLIKSASGDRLSFVRDIWGLLYSGGMYNVGPGCHDAQRHQDRLDMLNEVARLVGRGDGDGAKVLAARVNEDAREEIAEIAAFESDEKCEVDLDGMLRVYVRSMTLLAAENNLEPNANCVEKIETMLESLNSSNVRIPITLLNEDFRHALTSPNVSTRRPEEPKFLKYFLEGRFESGQTAKLEVILVTTPSSRESKTFEVIERDTGERLTVHGSLTNFPTEDIGSVSEFVRSSEQNRLIFSGANEPGSPIKSFWIEVDGSENGDTVYLVDAQRTENDFGD